MYKMGNEFWYTREFANFENLIQKVKIGDSVKKVNAKS